ncbi:MAG: phosphoribosyl-ATP diphosphatase [Parvularculaceae bacterium]
MTAKETLGEAINTLAATIDARAGEDASRSYTASLLAKGAPHCARKFGEEAVETVIAAVDGQKGALAAEAADALFHLLVLLKSCGVSPGAVAAALASRRRMSGIEEKASRSRD